MVEEVRQEALALSAAADHAVGLGVDSGAEDLRDACDRIVRPWQPGELLVLVAGQTWSLAPDLLAHFGIADVPAGGRAVLRLRRAAVPNYIARTGDDRTIEFVHALPERDAAFTRAMDRAGRDRSDAEAEVTAIRLDLDDARARAAAARPPRVTEPALTAPLGRQVLLRWRILWLRLVSFVVALVATAQRRLGSGRRGEGHPRDPSVASEPSLRLAPGVAVDALEAALGSATTRLESARKHLQQLHDERRKYGEERLLEFERDVRELASGTGRGADVRELVIELPGEHLPAEMTLVHVPGVRAARVEPADASAWEALRARIGASIMVSPHDEALAEPVAALCPHVLTALPPGDDPVFDLIRAERAVVRRVRLLADLEGALRRVHAAVTHAEGAVTDGIAALERERTPDVALVETSQVADMIVAVSESSKRIVDGATAALRARMLHMRGAWTAAIDAASDRSALERVIAAVTADAPLQIAAVVSDLREGLAGEMGRAADDLKHAALASVRARYPKVPLDAEAPLSVVTELLGADVASPLAVPLGGAIQAFERRRVEVGIAGAATGATIGSLVLPGIGTAVGAFLGVFAGFLERVATAKQDCTLKLHAYLDDAENQIRSRLDDVRDDVRRDLRLSLEEALHEVLERCRPTIARLIAAEDERLAADRRKRDELAALRASLEARERALRIITADAAATLRRGRGEAPQMREIPARRSSA